VKPAMIAMDNFMSVQNLIVGIIIILALFYIGRIVWRRIKSFFPKSSCGTDDCGCGTKSKPQKSFVKIVKS